MSELARVTGHPYYRNGRDVVDGWTEHWPAVINLVQYIADSDFVPKDMQGNKAAVAAAILAGRELGLGPMTSLQHVQVIEGKPALTAHMQRALALSAGAQILYEEMTSVRCRVRGRRAGTDEWTTVVWTIQDAATMGLAGKRNWRLMPRQMLIARATGELCRLIAADALAGMPYSVEELQDGPTERETAAIEAPRRTVRRERAPTEAAPQLEVPAQPPTEPAPNAKTGAHPSVDGPPLPGEPGYDNTEETPAPQPQPPEAAVPDPEPRDTSNWPITEPQLKKLHATLGGLGITDRQLGLAILARITDRAIDSSKNLTRRESALIIDTLTRIATVPDMVEELHRIEQSADPIAELAGLFGEVPDGEEAERRDVIDVDTGELT